VHALRRGASEAEVCNSNPTVKTNEDVGWFDVTVDNADCVGSLNPPCSFEVRPKNFPPCPVWVCLPFEERLAFDKFKCEKNGSVMLTDLVDLDDVGMREPGQCAGFLS